MIYLDRFTSKVTSRLYSFYCKYPGVLIRKFHAPSLPTNSSGEVLVHIGCGEVNDSRFINVDARAMPHIHYVSDQIDLHQFADDSVDLVYACHLLEHISHRKIHELLSHWHKKLRKGGTLRLSVPDFDCIVAIYESNGRDIREIQSALMGGQDYPTNFHYAALNKSYLTEMMEQAGFERVRNWDPKNARYHSFKDWSSSNLVIGSREYPISLNLEGTK